MDQRTAQKLYEEGAIFIFLEVPEGTEFGIDMKSWNTGEKFRGVKMIPPGIHYIFYSGVSTFGDTAPRTGFFHNFHKGEVFVKKWDPQSVCISKDDVKEEEIVKLKDNIRALDNFLGPYPYDIYDKWIDLTSHISGNYFQYYVYLQYIFFLFSDSLVDKLIPLSGYVQSALELEPCSDADRPRGKKLSEDLPNSSKDPKRSRLSSNSEDNFLPRLKAKEGTELRMTQFPDRNYPDGSTPAEITRHSLDLSYVFDTMVAKHQM